MSEGPFLVVGLGNPGPGYAGNRHNVGAMVLAELAARAGVRLSPGKGPRARSLSGEGRLAGRRVVLAVPSTYMNESGGPVRGLLDYHHLPATDLVVVHDELDLDYEVVRLKRGGGEGGHNGLRSISRSTGTRDYLRVRAGIGRPPGRQDPADYVLKDFSATERKTLELFIGEAADATELLLERGLEAAQNVVHPRS
ncbi:MULTISPECIES: aminoacyl-tRNA hydrolase [unclassified Modestobacter]|uniref:aminoacyl-tRNA hydrolase n=1 Tax=unclassified Modestobacter TaxID=2643866 RepID=UPI0022AB2528|nr:MULTISPECIES: aminoacyl-tRNA hydrolase [unclassified Modestobacter]MCZ2810487.1 aminoacyl-tRNA hydrolase [Modestobacter sp. VKM Ac-2979]MCZ2841973.1 aminoacyl-tRNA hydrolase [Modestobacter sp. VKM Ac-2980]MCZ2846978.1 aminoacyl-tRNA hydrolase [Modestobacter sp. VKM Ac-2978]